MNEIEFFEILKNNNVKFDDLTKERFSKYFDMLSEYNKVMDLTSVSEDEFYSRHFLDSIEFSFGSDFNYKSLCDVGSGAGFPAIPLKIIFPEMKLTIVDSMSKRMDFLKLVVKELNLKDVAIVSSRVEELPSEYNEKFDIVTARAVSRLNILVELVSRLPKVNGMFIALKGDKASEELDEAKNALSIVNFSLTERKGNTLFFVKTKTANTKYPRSFAKIKQKPL